AGNPSGKKEIFSTAWQSRELDLRTSTCAPLFAIAFCYCEDLMGNMLVHVILTAVRAYLGGNIFHDQGHTITIKGGGRRALFGFAVFADNALHMVHYIIHSMTLRRQEADACRVFSDERPA
ncbi:MAG: hypothetical protein Q8R70_04285, partial [Methanoregula sp.]|nr:hypothetical protein [Methanoregula sp.]